MCYLCASWILGLWLLEYIYVLLSLGPFMFDMPYITTSILSPAPGPSADPSVGLGGTTAPYLASWIWEWSYSILYSICRGFSLPSSGLNTSDHPHEGGSGYMNIGYTPYIPSYVPSSIASFLLNAVVMLIPPYTLYFGLFTDCFHIFWTNIIFI